MSAEGFPAASTKGVRDTAAERVRLAATGFWRSSWRNARKFAVSFALMTLQPIPWWFGYSQLLEIKDDQGQRVASESQESTYSNWTPSRLYCVTKSVTV